MSAGSAATNLGGGTAQTGILVGNGTSAVTAITPGDGVATALGQAVTGTGGIALSTAPSLSDVTSPSGSFWTNYGAANADIHRFSDRLFVDAGTATGGAYNAATSVLATSYPWVEINSSEFSINSHGRISNAGGCVASENQTTDPNYFSPATYGTITGGSGYVNGTYTNVPLTGGTGAGAQASSVTVAGGAVTSVTLNTSLGKGYKTTDTLSAAVANLGGSGTGFALPLASVNVPASCIGSAGVAFNDVSASGFTVPVWGGYFDSFRKAGAGTTQTMELDIGNGGTLVSVNPYSAIGYQSGVTFGIVLGAGGGVQGQTFGSPVSLAFGIGDNGQQFDDGIVFFQNSISNNRNAAITFTTGMLMEWWDNPSGTPQQSTFIQSTVTNTSDPGLLFSNTGLAITAARVNLSQTVYTGGSATPLSIWTSGNFLIASAGANGFAVNSADGTTTLLSVSSASNTGNAIFHGALAILGIPTSAGGGGLYVCVDTSGNTYKKASCP